MNPITGIIGPNGAGKTYCLQHLSLSPDAAFAQAGADIYFFGSTPRGHLRTIARIWTGLDVSHAEEILGFDPELPLRQLSVGQRQLLICATVLASGRPTLLFDEPFNGLDVDNRSYLRELLVTAAENAAVTLSSQHSQDLAGLVDHVRTVNEHTVSEPISLDELRSKHPVLSGPKGEVAAISADYRLLEETSLGGRVRQVLSGELRPSAADLARTTGVSVSYLAPDELIDLAASSTYAARQEDFLSHLNARSSS